MRKDALKGTVNEGKRTVFEKEIKTYRLYNELGVEISKNVRYEEMEESKMKIDKIASELGNY